MEQTDESQRSRRRRGAETTDHRPVTMHQPAQITLRCKALHKLKTALHSASHPELSAANQLVNKTVQHVTDYCIILAAQSGYRDSSLNPPLASDSPLN